MTTFQVQYDDMPNEEPLILDLTTTEEVTCEVCSGKAPGVYEATSGVGVCHPCFLGQLVQGIYHVVVSR